MRLRKVKHSPEDSSAGKATEPEFQLCMKRFPLLTKALCQFDLLEADGVLVSSNFCLCQRLAVNYVIKCFLLRSCFS